MTDLSRFAVYAEQINNVTVIWGYVYVRCDRESSFVALLILVL